MCNRIKRSSALLLLFNFLCYLTKGAAIKCFVCDSSDNPSCADLKSNSSIVPEECTLDKMKSLDTWLFDLNKFSYFDNGANKHPLMNCQKVVAKDPDTRKLVTARFCQLDTGDSDACDILRSKLKITSDSSNQRNQGQQRRRERDQQLQQQQQQQQRRKGYGQDAVDESPEEEFFCDICKSDRCNGAAAVTLTSSCMGAMGLLLFMLLPRLLLSN